MKLDIIILSVLEKGDRTGYSLMKLIKEDMGWKPSPGSMYPSLKSLLEKKYVTVIKKENKKIYNITEDGRNILSEFKKGKDIYLNEVKKHMSIFNHVCDSKEIKIISDMLDKIKEDGGLLNLINKDFIDFKMEIIKKASNPKTRDRLKLFIKKSLKELKRIE
ncbi:MAG: PadR family transcriptional regulator [archaeon]